MPKISRIFGIIIAIFYADHEPPHFQVDVAKLVPFEGVFAPLRDAEQFRQVRVHPELGTVFWPNGADLYPEVLYAVATGTPIHLTEPAKTR
ncbi:MAG: DUF2442 domain-containing protein [Thermoanaerobaculia bacterium]